MKVVLLIAALVLASLPAPGRAELSAEAAQAWSTARSLLDQGLPDPALKKMREATRLAPGDVDLAREYIDLMVSEGFASEMLAEYADKGAGADAQYLHGRALAAVGNLAGAREKFRAALAVQATHHWALQGMGSLALLEGRVDDAIGLLKGAVAAAPDRSDVHNRLASAYVRKGDHEAAFAAWRAATEVDSGDHHAWLNWGAVLSREGRNEEAANKLKMAVQKAPGYPLGHVNLAYVYVRLGRYDDAVAHFEVALAINPRNGTVAGSRDLVKRIASGSTPASAFEPLAAAMESETVDPATAEQKYKELLALVPDFGPGWMRLGLVQASMNKASDALESLEKSAALSPNDDGARYNLGYLLLGMDRPADARSPLAAAHELAPRAPDAITALALTWLAEGDADTALVWYEKALAINPSDPTLWVQYGTTQAAMGDFPTGAASIRKALELAPGFLAAQAQLVTILREGRRYDEALAELAKIEAVAPDNPQIQAERAAIEAAQRAHSAGKAGGVRISQVLLLDEAKANEARASLRGGKSFVQVARSYGQGPEAARGGDVGYVNKAEMRTEIASAVDALAPGQTSGLISLGGAWVIIQRTE